MSYKTFEKTKRYDKFMKDNWANLLYDKHYSKLTPSQKEKVHKGIENDKKHNDKDAKKIKKGK